MNDPQNAYSLLNKRVLVTGGGTGIGLGIAQCMAQNGAHVIITGRREAVLQAALPTLGPNANYVVHDVTELENLPAFIQHIEEEQGPLHTLVNNAGIHHKAWVVDTSDADFYRIMHTNVQAVFALSREVAKGMMARREGTIIMISSMAGLFGIDRVSAYGTAKTAVIGLMNALVTELSPQNVRVNTIAPGWIASDMFHKAIDADSDRKTKITNRIAMPGFGTPQDIGNAAAFLASPAARYISGAVLPVDGGASVNF